MHQTNAAQTSCSALRNTHLIFEVLRFTSDWLTQSHMQNKNTWTVASELASEQ